MRYTRFTFENFKGITKTVLDFTKAPKANILTLVGLNESGKTTLLEGINFFAEVLSASNDSTAVLGLLGAGKQDVRDAIPIGMAADFSGHISIAADIVMDDEDIALIREDLAQEHNFILDELKAAVKAERRVTFEHSNHTGTSSFWTFWFSGKRGEEQIANPGATHEIWQAVCEAIRKRVPAIWYFPNFLIDFPDKVFLSGPQEFKGKNDFYRRLMQDILSQQGEGLELAEHVRDRLLSSDDKARRTAEQLLLKLERDLTQQVFGAWEKVLGRSLAGKKITVSGSRDASNQVYLEFGIEGEDGLFRISERSLGFRWFFGFLLLTNYRSLRQGATRPVFLLDEPASNLHSAAQSELLHSFGRIAESSTIIYSTHSHHMINPDWLESLFVVKNEALEYGEVSREVQSRKTSVLVERYRSFVAGHPDQTTYFQPVLDVLSYRPSLLENVPDVAMVEGKSDFYVARLAKLATSDTGINLLPGGGAGTLDRPIQLYLGWGREFVGLLDGDREGEDQKRRYVERFGELVAERLFTLKEIDPKWKTIESLFSQDDALKVQQFTSPESTSVKKRLLHLAIQELVARKRVPDLSEETVANFAKLLKELRARLDRVRQ